MPAASRSPPRHCGPLGCQRAGFNLIGGKYGVSCVVTGTSGTVKLQLFGGRWRDLHRRWDIHELYDHERIATATAVNVSVIPISFRR
jgi:hypothetical protein